MAFCHCSFLANPLSARGHYRIIVPYNKPIRARVLSAAETSHIIKVINTIYRRGSPVMMLMSKVRFVFGDDVINWIGGIPLN